MPKNFTTGYNIFFAALVCVFWSILVSTSAVTLKDRQEANKLFDKQRNILFATGLVSPEGDLPRDQIIKKYNDDIRAYVVELKTGEVKKDIDANTYDQRLAASDAKQSEKAPSNQAKVNRVPLNGLVYHVIEGAEVKSIVVPVQGMGLWSTCYGYLALDADTTTIRGVAFYEHGETPGLGGEIQNPKWTALWKGRKALNDKFEPVFNVKKGGAGSIEDDPYSVDAITGATLTSNGVTNLVRFWLGDSGYGPYLERFRQGER
jgi:Na+-transporting NADH:ubiquinone oxidoreductase subunit C